MTVKDKILAALGCALDEISETRLIDILLDAYEKKKQRIAVLEGENAHERARLEFEHDKMREEYRRMLNDPLYCAGGEYFFCLDGRRFCFRVQGHHVEMFERRGIHDFAAIQHSAREWYGSSQ